MVTKKAKERCPRFIRKKRSTLQMELVKGLIILRRIASSRGSLSAIFTTLGIFKNIEGISTRNKFNHRYLNVKRRQTMYSMLAKSHKFWKMMYG